MSITTEIAQDRTDAARKGAARAAKTLTKRTRRLAHRSRILYADATAQAGRYLQRTPGLAKDVSARAAALVKSNPIKTVAIGAVLAAAGVAIGLFASRARA